eukprot:363696-Chlamydomonas_euryale.AAC.18
MVSGKKALADAGLPEGSDEIQKLDVARAGILIGTAMGGMKSFETAVSSLVQMGGLPRLCECLDCNWWLRSAIAAAAAAVVFSSSSSSSSSSVGQLLLQRRQPWRQQLLQRQHRWVVQPDLVQSHVHSLVQSHVHSLVQSHVHSRLQHRCCTRGKGGQ